LVSLTAAVLLLGGAARAEEGKPEPFVAVELGRAAAAGGDEERAYGLFKSACLAGDGIAEACLLWAELAERRDESRDRKRALASAVMLAPEDLRARFELARLLLERADYLWAIEHLEAAVGIAQDVNNLALLRYYLAYARFKQATLNRPELGESDSEQAELNDHLSELADIDELFAQAAAGLPPTMAQRARFYRALIAEELVDVSGAGELFEEVAAGPENAWSAAAASRLRGASIFPDRPTVAIQISGSLFGLNTYPTSAFLDDADIDSPPVVQTVHRIDASFSAGGYEHGFYGLLTGYREQSWLELGGDEDDGTTDAEFELGDFNVTAVFAQAGYLHHERGERLEHEVRLGVDGEAQMLDNPPVENEALGWVPGDGFGLFGWAVGPKLWWVFGRERAAKTALRFRFDYRPNALETNRSVMRFRVRAVHGRDLAGPDLMLRAMIGGRYDLSYADPAIVKYDRLVPEGELELRWRTPWRRLQIRFAGMLRYNWYLNSKTNADNSFLPTYESVDFEISEDEYYGLTRRDFEWEVRAELRLSLWTGSHLALNYKHHQRLSSIDHYLDDEKYDYHQDLFTVDLRQSF